MYEGVRGCMYAGVYVHKCVRKNSSCCSLLCWLDMWRFECVYGGYVCMYMRVLNSGFGCGCGLCM